MDILAIVLLVFVALFVFYTVYTARAQSKLQDKNISLVEYIHQESKFWNDAGKSSGNFMLKEQELKLQTAQAEADRVRNEAILLEQERLRARETGTTLTPRHGDRGLKRTKVEA